MISKLLKKGGLVVLPTDTLYGIHTSAFSESGVEKIYTLRGRDTKKPFIILISSINDLKLFDIQVDSKTETILKKYWPGKVSVVLPCQSPKFQYLHRGTKSLAFRLPDKDSLLALLKESGPLVSTSVNPEGMTPAKTIIEAKKYFGDQIDDYLDEGVLDSPPSTVITIENGKIKVLREGAVIIRSG
jgi:L-threonylcarbamoyladenylate synthase